MVTPLITLPKENVFFYVIVSLVFEKFFSMFAECLDKLNVVEFMELTYVRFMDSGYTVQFGKTRIINN